jgi:phenol 2-monooxygenase
VAREFVNNLPFTCGLTIQYEPGALTGAAAHQALASRLRHRQALPLGAGGAPGRRQADAPGPLHRGRRALPAVPVRARGRPAAAGGAVASLCDWLARDAASPLRRHTAPGEDEDAVIDTRAVFQQGFRALDHAAMPALLRPPWAATGCATTRRCSAPT